MTDTRETPTADVYDGAYYGVEGQPKANYLNYGPDADPHWARPLAKFLLDHGMLPIVDSGCAYGHLVRECNILTALNSQPSAVGIEWSEYAASRRVSDQVFFGDMRTLTRQMIEAYGAATWVTLDALEHLSEADGVALIADVAKTLITHMVHVIGCADVEMPDGSPPVESVDPTHVNAQPLRWYLYQFAVVGFVMDGDLTQELRDNPAWKDTDWYYRMVVLRRGTPEEVERDTMLYRDIIDAADGEHGDGE